MSLRLPSSQAWFRAVAALCLLAAAGVASAAVTLLGSRGQVGAGGVVDWLALGPEFTSVSNGSVVNPVTISGSTGTFTVLTGSTFNGDFLATETVLSLFDLGGGSGAGTFTIDFASGVYAAGAQVQANLFGAFSGLISAFDAANMLLGSYTINGNNAGNGDGSASFAGIASTAGDIRRLVFSGFGNDAAINRLSYQTVGASSPTVPEPGTWWLAGGALAMLAAGRRTRRA